MYLSSGPGAGIEADAEAEVEAATWARAKIRVQKMASKKSRVPLSLVRALPALQ